MSDIPSGWYPDPRGLDDERYHDGAEWTSQTRSTQAEQTSEAPRSDEGLTQQLLKAQMATMNYTRVLALVVMLFFANAFWGAIMFMILSLADPYDGPNGGLVAVIAICWFASFAYIAYLVGTAMTQARDARDEIGN